MKPLTLLFLVALIGSLSLYAQTNPANPADEPKIIPTDKPLVATEIEAERMRGESQDESGYFIFSGSVKLTATNLVITCNQLEVFTEIKDKDDEEAIGDFSSIQKIIAAGNVRIVQEERTVTAGKAEVLPNDDVIVLDENPMVFQNSITIDGTGAQALIHRGNGTIEWIGNVQNKIRITGPAIEDFGFEQNSQSIVPKDDGAKPNPSEANPDPKANEATPEKVNDSNRRQNSP